LKVTNIVSWAAILGSFAAVAQVVAYVGYLRLFLAGKIKPNAASWLMFAYGTAVMVVLEWQSSAHWFELALPIACASMSVVVAVLCLRKNATYAIDNAEKMTFGADVVLTIAYVISAVLIRGHTKFVVLFVVAGNITTFTSFAPLVISTRKEAEREQPLSWALWTVAYGLLLASTIAADGLSSPELLLYPGTCVLLHGLVAWSSLSPKIQTSLPTLPSRAERSPADGLVPASRLSSLPASASPRLRPSFPLTRTRSTERFAGVPNMTRQAESLIVKPSAIAGRGIHAAFGFGPSEEICTLTGSVLLDSPSERDPNSIGIARGVWIDPEFPLVFINHSCEPNSAFTGERTLVALRPIAAGEEVTMDYSTSEADVEWSMNCSCGSTACRSTLRSIQVAFADATEVPQATALLQNVWRDERAQFQKDKTLVTVDLTAADLLAEISQ
jgi:SET domain